MTDRPSYVQCVWDGRWSSDLLDWVRKTWCGASADAYEGVGVFSDINVAVRLDPKRTSLRVCPECSRKIAEALEAKTYTG